MLSGIAPSHLMSNPASSNPESSEPQPANEASQSFQEILSDFEHSKARKPVEAGKGREGAVVGVTADSVLVDIGYKTEGILPLTAFHGAPIKTGDKLLVSIKGRDPEGYYELSLGKIDQPKDWTALQKAFTEKSTITGRVTGIVKGGLTVDIGVRAFMPASRSGVRDAAEMAKLVEQEISCRITKLDEADEDVVVDRRIVLEEETRAVQQRRSSEVQEGAIVHGIVRTVTDYGAFIDIGGVDALLHVSDISRGRVNKPSDVLSVGQEVDVKILKVDREKRRFSVGMKQLEPDPWDSVTARLMPGERVKGTVTRLMDFGAFVELEPGIEGLIHVSEMSWVKKVRKPSDMLNTGDTVEAVILGVNPTERRIALGLKQALGDPWSDAPQKFVAGSVVEGPVTSITKFGAFVQLSEGIEGMIHVSDISAEKRINHPQDVLRVGQSVKAQVLEVDLEKRRLKLGMKQLVPTSIEEYIAEHKAGDTVSGRVIKISGEHASVELGEGVHASCRIAEKKPVQKETPIEVKADVASLSSMLSARWKGGGASAGASPPETLAAGQVRSFRIKNLDPATKQIEVELA